MTHPSDDVLVGLVIGEAAPREVAEHLAGCPHCQQTVVEVRRVESLLGEPRQTTTWPQPPTELWHRITAQLTEPLGEADAGQEPVVRLDSRRRPGRRRVIGYAAAAAALVVGIGIGRWALPDARSAPSQPPVAVVVPAGPPVQLTTLTGAAVPIGTAQLLRTADGRAEVRVSTQPFPRGTGFVEVWLINTDGRRMISIGVLGPARDGIFEVPDGALAAGYRVVDISRESFDALPQHSGDSVARGTLPA
ncbi:MAG: anti-sigma factor [Kineosporiaceae bacterium]